MSCIGLAGCNILNESPRRCALGYCTVAGRRLAPPMGRPASEPRLDCNENCACTASPLSGPAATCRRRSNCNPGGDANEICVSPIAGCACRYLLDWHLGGVRLSAGLCRAVWRRASGALLGLVGAIAMQKISSGVRAAICASAIAAFSMTMLIPTPASARWYHRGWGWHPDGIMAGVAAAGATGRLRCCSAGRCRPASGRLCAAARRSRRVWISPHWNGPYWVPGHWG